MEIKWFHIFFFLYFIMKYKKFPSLYELYYNKWNGIDFDKEKLIKLIRRIKLLKFTSIFYNKMF